jgi:predicted DNA-binding transcriptional regulator YafY
MAARTAEGRDEAGWSRVAIPIESVEHAAGEVLKLGAEAEVLAPPDLRGRMADLAARLHAVYTSG